MIESHIVQEGETLDSIANTIAPDSRPFEFGEYLARANGLSIGQPVEPDLILWYDTTEAATLWDPVTYDWTLSGAHLTNPEVRTGRIRLGGAYPSTPGQVLLENVDHTGPTEMIWADGPGITIRNVRTNSSIRAFDGSIPQPVVVEQCTIGGEHNNGIFGPAFTVRHCDITSLNDGLNPAGAADTLPSLIEYNHIHRPGPQEPPRHHDGIQLWKGGNMVIRRNRIQGWHTSAFLIKPDHAPIDNVLIEENWLGNSHGFFTSYVRETSHGRPTNVTIRNNAYDRVGGYPINTGTNAAAEGVFVRTEVERTDPTWVVFDGNYYADNGEEIVPPGGWHTV